MRIAFGKLVGIALVCIGAAGRAQDSVAIQQSELRALSLEELSELNVDLVYGASKFEQRTSEAPSAVSIVTAAEIKHFGHRTLADVLRSVRGIDVTSDRQYGYIGFRGFNRPGDFGGRTLVMVNGHRLNDPIYESSFCSTEFLLDVDLIERVEIIRGPGSSIYGNNAFLGVINVVTKAGHDIRGVETSMAVGTFDSYQGRFSCGNKFQNDLDVLISGTIYDSAGHKRLYYREFDTLRDNDGVAENLDEDAARNIFSSMRYHGLTFEGGYVSRKKAIPTASFGAVFNDSRHDSHDRRGYTSLKVEHEFDGEWKLEGRLYADYYGFEEVTPMDLAVVGPAAITLNKDQSEAHWGGVEAQVTKTFLERFRVIGGGEWRENFRVRQENFDIAPYQKYLDARTSSSHRSAFAQVDASVVTNVIVNTGIRYDRYSTFGETWNPRVALIWTPLEVTAVKLIYGNAFRAPNEVERLYESSYTRVNPHLEPETIRSYEIVLEQKMGNHMQASVSAFQFEIDNLIGPEEDSRGLFSFRNHDGARARGVELEVAGRWGSGLRAQTSCTVQEAEDEQTHKELSNAPDYIFKSNLAVPLYRQKVFAGFELQACGERLDGKGGHSEAFAVANLTLFSCDLVKGLEASASIYNVFDAGYHTPGSDAHRQRTIEQDGRTFRLKFTYRF